MYEAVKLVIFDQIRTLVLGERISKYVDKYFEANKATEALGKRMLGNDELPTSIASLDKMPTKDATIGQKIVDVFGTTSMEICPRKNAVMAAEADLVSRAPAHTSS